jgi:hypothetical protein
MVVEWSEDELFRTRQHRVGPVTGPEADHTAKLLLRDLPPGRRISYRVCFEDRQGVAGDWEVGSLVTASANAGKAGDSAVHFVWSGDTCGQGYGIDESRGGMRTYQSMLAQDPQFFVHSGDTIYADDPLVPELRLPDGTVWKNRVTEEKSKVAETLGGVPGLRVHAPQAGMFVMLSVDGLGLDGEAFADRLLAEERVAVMPGSAFGAAAAGMVRMSLTVPDAALAEGCARLAALARRRP